MQNWQVVVINTWGFIFIPQDIETIKQFNVATLKITLQLCNINTGLDVIVYVSEVKIAKTIGFGID